MKITKNQVLHTNKIQAEIIGELRAENFRLQDRVNLFEKMEVGYLDETRRLTDLLAAKEHAWIKLVQHWGEIEARSEEAHKTYQDEAHRRGDVRHPDSYADLSEPTKEWDRVLVRWVQRKLEEWHTFDNDDALALTPANPFTMPEITKQPWPIVVTPAPPSPDEKPEQEK